jgi:hypothetical protein
VAPPANQAPPAQQNSGCDPSYPDNCLPSNGGDWDCEGGSGNGPHYIRGPIRVLQPDPFRLNADKDGEGCE